MAYRREVLSTGIGVKNPFMWWRPFWMAKSNSDLINDSSSCVESSRFIKYPALKKSNKSLWTDDELRWDHTVTTTTTGNNWHHDLAQV